SQAAISLENSRLYAEVREREGRVRRLVDSNIIGIFIWDLDVRIIVAHETFVRMVGDDQSDIRSGKLSWIQWMAPEWRENGDRLRLRELEAAGIVKPFEWQYVRKDQTRLDVLIGLASFQKGGKQGVAFVLDLSEQKRAQAEAYNSEMRYQKAQI